jgi:hypothetical protein
MATKEDKIKEQSQAAMLFDQLVAQAKKAREALLKLNQEQIELMFKKWR